jgi:hypothetical protein
MKFFFIYCLISIFSLSSLYAAIDIVGFNRSDTESYDTFHRQNLRKLQSTTTLNQKFGSKRMKNKNARSAKLLQSIESFPVPDYFKPDADSPSHNPAGPAVFTVAMGGFLRFDAMMFAGSLRETGYKGDIVVAVQPNSDPRFMKVWKYYGCIIYTVSPNCTGEAHSRVCSLYAGDNSPAVSINMVRFYMYQWWARKYNSEALILVSDFRDVFFQANPFNYKPHQWAPPVAQFVAFQEPYPNKVIYRCAFNSGWISNCYGEEGLQKIGLNTVSCSGVSIATKDALVIYVSKMNKIEVVCTALISGNFSSSFIDRFIYLFSYFTLFDSGSFDGATIKSVSTVWIRCRYSYH